jgi:DNA-binding NtrC family response regulator
LKALKAAHPRVQVIMLSGREQASIIVEAVRRGAADYVVKPDDPEGLGEIALDAAIKKAIECHRLTNEIADLRCRLSDEQNQTFVGDSPAMQQVMHIIERVADSDVTVLIRGESGVGKELVARALHQRSSRRNKPFVKVNCAALPAELLESELFGHEKGAFTGAATTRVGKFEQAHCGTIFLDEIGEIPPPAPACVDDDETDASSPMTEATGPRRLTVVAREAALVAERQAISEALRQVHWNRRKAAQLLNVSYKTLLNKIKETGIEPRA